MLRTQSSKHWAYCVRLWSKLLNVQQGLFFLPVKSAGDASKTERTKNYIGIKKIKFY